MREHLRRARVFATAAALVMLALPAGAQALPSDQFDESAFVADGPVNAITRSGSTTYIGGDFTQLSFPSGPGVRLSGASGRRFAPSPNAFGGDVLATAPDGAGGYYIGGEFIAVDGFQRNRVAHILPSGAVDPTFDPGNTNGTVRALAVSGGAVYAGGDFTQIGGAGTHNRIAKLSGASGNAFSGFSSNPGADGSVYALDLDGSSLYAGGAFNNIGNAARQKVAKLSATSGNAFSAFNAGATNDTVFALDVDGSGLYAGGSFTQIGGSGAPGTRNRLAKLSTTSGNAFSAWNPGADAQVNAITAGPNAVYAAGDFLNVGCCIHQRVAAISKSTGSPFSAFAPPVEATQDSRGFALAVSPSRLYFGGTFTQINTVPRIGYAEFAGTP